MSTCELIVTLALSVVLGVVLVGLGALMAWGLRRRFDPRRSTGREYTMDGLRWDEPWRDVKLRGQPVTFEEIAAEATAQREFDASISKTYRQRVYRYDALILWRRRREWCEQVLGRRLDEPRFEGGEPELLFVAWRRWWLS